MDETIRLISTEGTLVVGSREVAKNFNKEHYNLVRDIENLIKKQPLKLEGLSYFIKTTFEHKGNEYKEYLLTRDGLSLLVMGFSGAKALDWKIKYIDAFNKLEKMNLEKQPLKLEGSNKELLLQANRTIKELEESLVISYEEANEIKNLARQRVLILLKNSEVTKTKLYGSLWREYRKEFNITSYHNTLKKDLENAKKFIESWSCGKGDSNEF